MKNKIVSFSIVFAIIISFTFLTNVKAYKENAFTDGKCITNSDWQANATTSYKLNTDTGTYELEGDVYSEENASSNYIYYLISEDGKVLYGLVPNYDGVKNDSNKKDAVAAKEISTEADCSSTYIVSKTVEGNPPSSDSATEFESDNNVEATTETPSNTDENSDESGDVVKKIEAPNTASPAAVAVIIVSLLLIAYAVYSMLRKTAPDMFRRRK